MALIYLQEVAISTNVAGAGTKITVKISDRPNFGYGYSFGTETASKASYGPVLVSANRVSAKLRLRP